MYLPINGGLSGCACNGACSDKGLGFAFKDEFEWQDLIPSAHTAADILVWGFAGLTGLVMLLALTKSEPAKKRSEAISRARKRLKAARSMPRF